MKDLDREFFYGKGYGHGLKGETCVPPTKFEYEADYKKGYADGMAASRQVTK